MLRTAVIGFLIVSLAGCSQLQILYGNGAYLIESNVEDYLNQTEEDRFKLKKNIERLLKWHRTEMLVSYSRFLDEQIFMLKKGAVTKKQIIGAVRNIRMLIEKTLKGAAPFIAAVLERHTSHDKVSYLAERFEEETLEGSMKTLTNKDERKKRADKVKANFERLMGNLNQTQLKIIDIYINASEKHTLYWRDRRIKRRENLVDFLKKNPRKNEIELFLVNLLSSKGTDTISEEWWTHLTNILTDVAASLETKQLTELLLSFKSYSSDMKLIAQKE